MVQALKWTDVAPGASAQASIVQLGAGRRAAVKEHFHADFWEAVVISLGSALHRTSEATQRLCAGDIVLLAPRSAHSLRSSGSASTVVTIAFARRFWEAMWDAVDVAPVSVPPDGSITYHGAATTAIGLEVGAVLSDLPRTQSQLAALRCWTALVDAISEPSRAVSQPWLRDAISALRTEQGLRAGIDGMLEAAPVSPSHLARTVRAEFGLTPTELITASRLEYAARLLNSTDLAITTISYRCGFTSLSYLDRCFKERYGMTPTEFRVGRQDRLTPGP